MTIEMTRRRWSRHRQRRQSGRDGTTGPVVPGGADRAGGSLEHNERLRDPRRPRLCWESGHAEPRQRQRACREPVRRGVLPGEHAPLIPVLKPLRVRPGPIHVGPVRHPNHGRHPPVTPSGSPRLAASPLNQDRRPSSIRPCCGARSRRPRGPRPPAGSGASPGRSAARGPWQGRRARSRNCHA